MDYKLPNLEKFENLQNKMFENFESKYSSSIGKLKKLFQKYSKTDIIYSLFSMSLWLKNISSHVKMKLVYMVFFSMKEKSFNKGNQILKFEDFSNFTTRLIKILPEFPMLEDYFPEADWGEIKYHFDNINYKILYGSDIDGIYDFIQSFELVHCSIDNQYKDITGQSPKYELKKCLSLQELIINSIENNVPEEEINDLEIGYLEVPPMEFWIKCCDFYSNLSFTQFNENFLEKYSSKIGSINDNDLIAHNFLSEYHNNKNFNFFFLKFNNRYYPILPRRFIAVLIESWADIYKENENELLEYDKNLLTTINYAIYHYTKSRLGGKYIFEFAIPYNITLSKSNQTIYPITIKSKNELYLFYILNPCFDEIDVEDQINKISKELKKDLETLNEKPMGLFLSFREKDNVIGFKNDEYKIIPKICLIIPRLKYTMGFRLSADFPQNILFLEDYLGIFDEIFELDEISSFFTFFNNELLSTQTRYGSLFDIFAVYKEQFGIVYPGADEPDFISFEPGFGCTYRYKSLKNFWTKFPEWNFFDNPRTWEIKESRNNKLRIVSRNMIMSALYAKVKNLDILMNAPFHKLDCIQFNSADLLLQIIQDGFIQYSQVLEAIPFFSDYKKLHIYVFPYKIVNDFKEYSHLKHLDSKNDIYKIEYGFSERDVPSLRVSFNCEQFNEALLNSTTRQFQLQLFLSVLENLEDVFSYKDKYLNEIEKDFSELPRHTFNLSEKPASFPEVTKVIIPSNFEYKRVVKEISEIAFEKNITPGEYTIDKAKIILNELKSEVVNIINKEVNLLDYLSTIKKVISCMDSLTHEYEMKRIRYEESLKHDVDYDRKIEYAENQAKYSEEYKNYKYLVEKTVQLSPKGSYKLSDENVKYLLALIDWLHVIQHASDAIHYGINPVGITVKNDFRVEVKYSYNFSEKEKEFVEEEAEVNLDTIHEKVDNKERDSINTFLDKLDVIAQEEYGFNFIDFNTVLYNLRFWSDRNKNAKESYYCSATLEEMNEITNKYISDGIIEREAFTKIIDFLTLKSESILKIIGQEGLCLDLPIWEHNKRFMRINLRPIIKINDKFYWGTYSIKIAQTIWMGFLASAIFPYDIENSRISKLFYQQRKIFNNEFNNKVARIVSTHTDFVKENFWPNKIREFNIHDIGDYDVLAFIKEKNILLNIECKDIEPNVCLKDTKRTREKFFGKDSKERGYFEKVIKREEFLIRNTKVVVEYLEWPLEKEIKIVSIFVLRKNHWWTSIPPFETDVKFIRIEKLGNFIKNL